MRFYTNVQLVGNQLLVRGYDNGEHFMTREEFRPTLFVDSKRKTKFKTLDGVERILHSEDLMICDDKEAHCIAGIFGGEKSGINNKTNNVFLESAYFDPVSIRKTSKLI